MKHRARKAWSGGERPELNEQGKAVVAHAESCEVCKRETILFGCDVGKALARQFDDSMSGRREPS